MDFSSREIRQLELIHEALCDGLKEKNEPEFLLEGYQEIELIKDALQFVVEVFETEKHIANVEREEDTNGI